MTKRTTNQWEALLDGAADGPWEVKLYGDDLVASICTTAHDPKRFVGDTYIYIYGERNAHLVAAAPEAVAEIVRLRQAIARLRDYYIHMDYGIAADDLTRILEGEGA